MEARVLTVIKLNKKKLVFLSCRVYEKAKEHRLTNGTNIAREILEESRKLRMNFDFKNVQRRVYDALNVLTALDMIKKDRNKIEFIRDISEVFGESTKKSALITRENIKFEKQTEINNKIKQLKDRKEAIAENIKQKRQYFDELIFQVALLKKLVRRNWKIEDDETTLNTPDKGMSNNPSLDKFQQTQKIHLPMLVLEYPKDSYIEILMNEDHTNMVVVSDQPCSLYNDNHVLMRTGLINDIDQGNIESLYEAEVKPACKFSSSIHYLISQFFDQRTVNENGYNNINKEDEARSPSSEISEDKNINLKDLKTPKVKGFIDNISSPFKEQLLSCSKPNFPFNNLKNFDSCGKLFIDVDQSSFLWRKCQNKNGLAPHFADECDNPFKNDTFNKNNYDQMIKSPYSNYMYTPMSKFGMNDQGADENLMLSPTLGIKKNFSFCSPLSKH